MRLRLPTLFAACGLAVAVVPASASPSPTPQIIDSAGDANALNDQGVFIADGFPENTPTGPASISAADITSVSFVNTFATKKIGKRQVRVPTGFTVTMTLVAAPTVPSLFYRVAGSIRGCPTLYFEYSTAPGESRPGSARCAALPPASNRLLSLKSVRVVGTSIIWTVPVSSVPVGSEITGLNAQTRGTVSLDTPAVSGGPTVPQIDYASSHRTFTVGR